MRCWRLSSFAISTATKPGMPLSVSVSDAMAFTPPTTLPLVPAETCAEAVPPMTMAVTLPSSTLMEETPSAPDET